MKILTKILAALLFLALLFSCKSLESVNKKTLTTDGIGAGEIACDRRITIRPEPNPTIDLSAEIRLYNYIENSFCVIRSDLDGARIQTIFLLDGKAEQHIELVK
jgi:hypothetical protein